MTAAIQKVPTQEPNNSVSAPAINSGHCGPLDSLRFIGAFLVMISHYLDPAGHYGRFGTWGVWLFFVLSGYLIGGILLDARERVDRGVSPLGHQLSIFYARRALRIFPAYYVLLLGALLVGLPPIREFFGWAALYLINVKEVMVGQVAGIYGHLYTLSIEEQFYLLCPLCLLCLPRKALVPFIIGIIFLGLLYRNLVLPNPSIPPEASRLLFCEMDQLAIGVLLAWLEKKHLSGLVYWKSAVSSAAIVLGLTYFFVYYLLPKPGWAVIYGLSPLIYGLACVCLIFSIRQGSLPVGLPVLKWRWLQFLGKISYGIYLYHNFAGWALAKPFRWLGWAYPPKPVEFPLLVGLSIFAAVLSWYLLEKPFNDLKRHFPYLPGAPLLPRSANRVATGTETNIITAGEESITP
jgi:peptidoglycan/LPS O-acetylase OafA/YrhL